jgi:Ran GTPase-activating protein (RanGAP) involved in mRNA processing and transport
MDAQSAGILARRLPQLKNLQSMALCGNPIGAEGLKVLVDEGNFCQIAEVDLWDCGMGDEGAAILGRSLTEPNVMTQRLVLDMNSIGDEGIRALAEGLANNTSLQTLHLCCNDIGDEELGALVSSISSNGVSQLEELSLCANHIGGLGAKAIASRVNDTCLRKLYLGHNCIRDEGALYLADALQAKESKLEELTLSWNGLGNKSVVAMSTALTSNPPLQRLALDGNPQVDRRGATSFVQCLRQHNKRLMALQVLEQTYGNHLLNDKLDFYLEVNKLGRQYLGDLSIPHAAWPRILGAMDRPDHLFMLLRERPDVIMNRM